MKFNKLDVPYQWKEYFTKYPHGYTIFEALCNWTKQVDDMVDNVNDWNKYLDEFVNNFKFELREEVTKTLTEWKNDGVLDDIIGLALDNIKATVEGFENRVVDVEQNIKGIISHPESNFTLSHLLRVEGQTGADDGDVKHGWMQGFCIVGDNIVFAREAKNVKTNTVKITEISMSSQQIVREVYLELGHANDMEYIPMTGEILCTPSSKYVEGEFVNANEIVVIDYGTLTIKKRVTLPYNANAIGYDRETGEIAFRWGHTVYYIDDEYNITKTVSCDVLPHSGVGQGMCLDNGYIYMNKSFPEVLHVYDSNGKIVRTYQIPRYTEQGNYIYETESIKPLGDGKFILGAVHYKDRTLETAVVDFFTWDIYNKTPAIYKNMAVDLSRHNDRTIRLYVDSTYSGLDSDGSENKPYKDIQDAINVCNNRNFKYLINIKPGNYGFVSMITTPRISLWGGSATTNGQYTVRGIELTQCDYIELVGLTFLYNPFLGTAPFRSNDTHVRLANCSIDGEGAGYCLSVSNSNVWFSGTTKLENSRLEAIYGNNRSYIDVIGTLESINNGSYACMANGSVLRVSPPSSIGGQGTRVETGGAIYENNERVK